jgi:hypothetical protein
MPAKSESDEHSTAIHNPPHLRHMSQWHAVKLRLTGVALIDMRPQRQLAVLRVESFIGSASASTFLCGVRLSIPPN